MNKVVFVLAVVAVAVLASEKYKAPKLPCAYELKIKEKSKSSSKASDVGKYTVNGRYLRMKIENSNDDSDIYGVYRPDIQKTDNGIDYIGIAATSDKKCESDWAPLKAYLLVLDGMYTSLFGGVNAISWDSKEEGAKYDGDKCTLYKNKALGINMYVKDDYPYVIQDSDGDEEIYEWSWSAPMSKFKLEDCSGDFGKTPSSDYVFCAASSVKVAFVAVLAALLAALF